MPGGVKFYMGAPYPGEKPISFGPPKGPGIIMKERPANSVNYAPSPPKRCWRLW
jgi:hypothetical protein